MSAWSWADMQFALMPPRRTAQHRTLDESRQIHFQSVTGRLYTLDFNDTVASNSWMTVPWQSRVPGLGTPQFLRDNNSLPPFCSYRLGVELP